MPSKAVGKKCLALFLTVLNQAVKKWAKSETHLVSNVVFSFIRDLFVHACVLDYIVWTCVTHFYLTGTKWKSPTM